MTKGQKVRKKQ